CRAAGEGGSTRVRPHSNPTLFDPNTSFYSDQLERHFVVLAFEFMNLSQTTDMTPSPSPTSGFFRYFTSAEDLITVLSSNMPVIAFDPGIWISDAERSRYGRNNLDTSINFVRYLFANVTNEKLYETVVDRVRNITAQGATLPLNLSMTVHHFIDWLKMVDQY